MLRRSSDNSRPGNDVKCSDGFVDHGWRKVAKDCTVRMHKSKHHSELLEPFIGKWVLIESDDCWGIHVSFRPFGFDMNETIPLTNLDLKEMS